MTLVGMLDEGIAILVRLWKIFDKVGAWLSWLVFVGLVGLCHFVDGGLRTLYKIASLLNNALAIATAPAGVVQKGVHSLQTVATSSTFTDFFSFFNSFFPLDVLGDCILAYWSLWVMMMIYRVLKSWIPAVSG